MIQRRCLAPSHREDKLTLRNVMYILESLMLDHLVYHHVFLPRTPNSVMHFCIIGVRHHNQIPWCSNIGPIEEMCIAARNLIVRRSSPCSAEPSSNTQRSGCTSSPVLPIFAFNKCCYVVSAEASVNAIEPSFGLLGRHWGCWSRRGLHMLL